MQNQQEIEHSPLGRRRLSIWADGRQPSHFWPDECNRHHHQDGADTSSDDRDDRAEELCHQGGLEATQFIGCPDKDEIDG